MAAENADLGTFAAREGTTDNPGIEPTWSPPEPAEGTVDRGTDIWSSQTVLRRMDPGVDAETAGMTMELLRRTGVINR